MRRIIAHNVVRDRRQPIDRGGPQRDRPGSVWDCLEPALYDVARGMPAVEQHIDVITHARALADAGDLYGFRREVRPVMFGGTAEQHKWAAEQVLAARFSSVELPWGHA